MVWVISYYSRKVEQDVLALPLTLRAKYARSLTVMREYGANLGEPHTKALGSGLFELRLKGEEGIARVFFCTVIDKKIVMLHSFIKKDQKTPLYEMEIARKRLREVKDAVYS